ncbi:hypothetical protein HAX54_048288, partial [Datura stramonium]|nr:hypothetical protein [Datura stramonium]
HQNDYETSGQHVLENEVTASQKEVNRRREMQLPMDFDLNIPPAGQDPPVVASSPSDDWCLGYIPTENAPAIDVREREPLHVQVLPSIEASHLEDPYRVAPIYSYYEARTLLDRWIMTVPGEPLALPPNPLIPSVKDIASRYFS